MPRRPTYKQCLLALVFGVATTIALAWAAAITLNQPNYNHYTRRTFLLWGRAWECAEFHNAARHELVWVDLNDQLPGDPTRTVADRKSRMLAAAPLDPRLAGVTFDNTPPTWSIFAQPEPPARGIQGTTVVYGWPFPCLEYSLTNKLAPNRTWDHILHNGLIIRGSPGQPYAMRALPLKPHWISAIADVALFALLFLTTVRTIPLARRHLRRRKNLCPHCAYHRAGLPQTAPCPECGRKS